MTNGEIAERAERIKRRFPGAWAGTYAICTACPFRRVDECLHRDAFVNSGKGLTLYFHFSDATSGAANVEPFDCEGLPTGTPPATQEPQPPPA